MAYETVQQTHAPPAQPAHMVEELSQFDGPPEQFLSRMLAVQCRIGSADGGVIVRASPEAKGGHEVLAVYPAVEPDATPPSWLAQAVELAPRVLKGGEAEVLPLRAPDELYGLEPSRFLVLLPLRGGTAVRGVAGFVVRNSDAVRVDQSRQRLELTLSLLTLYEMRLTLRRRQADLRRLSRSCRMLSELNEQGRFKALAMALCNQTATAFGADRVSVGLIKGRYVKVQAISHTEKFTRKMEVVQAIESAMEECTDQDLEVVHPSDASSTTISRSARELATRYGPSTVLSLPLRHEGEAVGALTVERSAEEPFEIEEVEALRLTCDLCTARLVELERRDRWFGAKAAAGARSGVSWLVGPRHTWVKAAAVGVALLLGWFLFATGTYRIESPFVVEAVQRQVLAAPFEGYLLESTVRPGDVVTAGVTVLAELDTSQLHLELAEARAEHASHLKRAQIARRENEITEEQIARMEAERAQARADLLAWKIGRARITSPMDGVVVTGDLTRQLGAPVSAGDTLFEVAPLESLRAQLAVPEDRVADLSVGQRGKLAALSSPGDYLEFEVERIDPVAEVVDQRNVFHVRVMLMESPPPRWLRPGMEGVAKVDVDERSLASIWTRDLINWIRMKLWL